MTTARKEVVIEGQNAVYSVISRCVRKEYLCGKDKVTGKDYRHRKKWRIDRLKFLSNIFAIEVCAYAVMSNHAHENLRTRFDIAESWSEEEVAKRWLNLFPRRREENGKPCEPSATEIYAQTLNKPRIKILRNRLCSISWFMKSLNEYTARRANKEDECTGRFWEGRFKCKRLLDDSAVIASMVYTDLNEIRAKIASTPESSKHSSISNRAIAKKAEIKISKLEKMNKSNTSEQSDLHKTELIKQKRLVNEDDWLCPIQGTQEGPMGLLPITRDEYLALVDYTGRQIRQDKRGSIPDHIEPILERLDIEVENWLKCVQNFDGMFCRVAGKLENIIKAAQKAGKAWFKGHQASKIAFNCS